MIKKIVTLLLCLSTISFANTPERHRTVAMAPDALPTQSSIQSRAFAVTEPQVSIYTIPEVVQGFIDNLPATAKMSEKEKIITANLIDTAKRHLGARYHTGSVGPKSFDCSGFTSFVFKNFGITLKRTSQEQNTQGEAIAMIKDLLPGDLVFFGHGGKRIHHVGIVTDVANDGTFNFIHASVSRGVRIDSTTDDYWSLRFVGARRVIGVEI